MTAIPPPSWPISDDTGKLTQPWYNYLKAADDTWRVKVTDVTSLTTTADPTKNLLANSGVAVLGGAPPSSMMLADPVPGCRMTICVASTSTASRVALQTTTKFFRNQSTVAGSTGWRLNFSSSAPYKAVELLGISTFEYLIVSNIGTVTVTTA